METSEIPFTQLREYDTLTRLFATIPKHVKSSRFGSRQEFSWTSVSVSDKFIAIGTDVGVVFVYDRVKCVIQHELSYQEKPDGVSCVRLINSVDDSIAVGHASGVVVVYHLPSVINGRKMRAFFVKDSHATHVTCLQWSLNAMKLFSGDSNGLVVCTEIDYESFTSRSFLVCREPHSIVQLDYSFRTLLVSTLSRSFLCHLDNSNDVVQIGQTERKCNGKFGAVFLPGICNINESTVYASRPGHRVWKASSSGTVETTLLFRDQIVEASLRITLQRDVVLENSPTLSCEERQFGCLLLYGSSCLLTYSGNGLYVVDRDVAAVICYHSNVGSILDVAVCGDDIYVLRKFSHRPLLRLSSRRPLADHVSAVRDKVSPVPVYSPVIADSSPVTDSMPSIRSLGLKAAKMKGGFVNALKEVGEKVQKLPVQSFIQMPFVAKTTGPMPAKNDAINPCSVNSGLADQNDNDSVLQGSGLDIDALDGAWKRTFTEETAVLRDGFFGDALIGLQVLKQSDVNVQSWHLETAADDNIPHPVSVQSSANVLCNLEARSEVGEKLNSGRSVDGLQNCSVSTTNDTNSAEPDVNYPTGLDANCLAENPVTITAEESQYDNIVDEMFTNPSSSSLLAPFTTGVASSHTTVPLRVFSLSPEEDTVDIVFSSKRNSAKRVKKLISKQSSISSKYAETESIASVESNESGSQVVVASCSSVEGGSASTFEQTVAESTLVFDSPRSSIQESETQVDLEIDLSLLRNDQPILAFVPMPSLNNELPEKSQFQADDVTCHTGPVDDDACLPSSNEIRRDSTASVPVVKEIPDVKETTEITQPSSLEDDFYSVYRSAKTKSITTSVLTTVESIETKATVEKEQIVDNLSSLEDYTTDLLKEEVLQSAFSNGKPAKVLVAPLPMHNTDPLTSNATEMNDELNIPFANGLTVDIGRPSCSLVTSSYKMADRWVLMPAPANILCISVSMQYVWCVDHAGRLFYSALHGPGLKWFSVTTATAQQVRVSPSGALIWRIDGRSVYAASGVKAKRQPWGTKWLEVARDVSFISVDESVAWYVKIGGEVAMQKGLSRERPGYRAVRVESSFEIVQVVCRGGVVWGLTVDRTIVVRLGIDSMKEEGTEWAYLKGSGPEAMVASIDLSDDGTAWVIDVVGRLWFTTDISPSKPQGSGLWWQASLDHMNEPEAAIALKSQPLVKLIGTDYGGLVSAGCNGVWICPRYKDVLHICRESFVGHRWQLVTPGGMWLSTKWNYIHPTSSQSDPSGGLWLVQSNGAMFCLVHNADSTAQLLEVVPPEFQSKSISISSNSGIVWCLLDNGHVYIRKGIQRRCRQGLEWQRVNMIQLDQRNEKLCQVSIGSQSVWALSTSGTVYFRLGVTQPPPPHNPAWVPVIDDEKHPTVFSYISSSTNDSLIWAISRDQQVFTRCGVSDDLLFGTHWSLVFSGCKMQQLACSNSAVYSVDVTGQTYVRLGIHAKNSLGSNWRKIPGVMNKLAVTPDDELWGINPEAQLFQRQAYSLQRKPVLENLVRKDEEAHYGDNEWVLL